jgi:hypothetical protein
MALTIYEKAILDTIAYAEGTLGVGNNGYDILVGFPRIIGWSTNTKIKHRCVKPTGNLTSEIIGQNGGKVCEDKTWFNDSLSSSAAGRYQFLGSTWATSTKKLGLGFNAPMTANNQDKVGIRLVKTSRKVTDTELENGVKSLENFKVIINKLKNEWTSFKLNQPSNKKSPKDYWTVYKYAVDVYKKGGATTNSTPNRTTSGMKIIDSTGKEYSTLPKSDKTKFIVNIPTTSSTKIVYFFSGLETVISREDQYAQIPQYVKDNYYIVMSAGVGSAQQPTLATLKGVATKIISNSITERVLLGYSAGARPLFNSYNTNFTMVGFIDPYVSNSDLNGITPGNNVSMVYWPSNWGSGITATNQPLLVTKIINGAGATNEVDVDHKKMIQEWFNIFGFQLNTTPIT